MYDTGQSLRMIHTDHSTTPLKVGQVYVIGEVKLYPTGETYCTVEGLQFNTKEICVYFTLNKPKTKRPLPEWF